jgi:RNA polymerase sigma factor (sigma-70 family)
MPDDELWRRAAEKEGRAFGELFERHSDSVYNHCFRRTGSWSTAQDLTSVVFLEAWRRKKDVKLVGDSILPWFLAVANNVIRNSERSLRRHRRLLAKLPALSAEAAFDEDAVQRLDDEIAMKSLLRRLGDLRTEEQEIVALCDWASLTYAEAAIALGIPIGTVRSRLSRAHEHLRAVVSEGEATDEAPIPAPISSLERLGDDPS